MRLIVTSSGTCIAKSFITAAMVRQAISMGQSVAAYKPVISGFDPAHAEDSDTGLLLQSLNLPASPENIDRISPWRFAAPLAPSMAARLEHRTMDFSALVAHGKKVMSGPEDIVLIEGVGGVMAPLDDKHTVIDWIAALDIEALLVTGSYLGTISHTLTALDAMKHRQIPVHSIVMSESEDSSVSLADTVEELSRWTRLPIVGVTRRANNDWRDVKELHPLLAQKEAA